MPAQLALAEGRRQGRPTPLLQRRAMRARHAIQLAKGLRPSRAGGKVFDRGGGCPHPSVAQERPAGWVIPLPPPRPPLAVPGLGDGQG